MAFSKKVLDVLMSDADRFTHPARAWGRMATDFRRDGITWMAYYAGMLAREFARKEGK